jgi:hypothetical protein
LNKTRQLLTCASLVCVGLSQLVFLHTHVRFFGLLSIAALLVLPVAALPRLQVRERVLIAVALLLTVAAITKADDYLAVLERAGMQAAFLTAFMVLLSLLRDGAITSPSVLQLGRFLTSRSPGRRYLAIHTGGQLLGMVLNFGALTLLGPLIQRGAHSVRQYSEKLANWREQRQISALTRGFSWTIAWSPATVSMAITVSVVKDANLLVVCFYGIATAVGSLLVGWLLDRRTGQIARASLAATDRPQSDPSPFPWSAASRVTLVCIALFVITTTMIVLNDSRIVSSLMLASPIVTLVWLVFQQQQSAQQGSHTLMHRLKDITVNSIPAGVPEAITLASAGYIGVIVVALVNPDQVASVTGITNLSEPWLYLVAMAAIPVLSNLAMPPILTVTVLGGLYSTLPFDGIEPDILACALIWGWALNLTASPFGGVPLILGRITGISSTRLSWHWNGVFSILMFLWCTALLAILTL